ncbi:MAG: hypothetical protein WDZ39_01375 [Candidatus Spechtbacterales bacterium]
MAEKFETTGYLITYADTTCNISYDTIKIMKILSKEWYVFALILVLGLGVFFRFWGLESAPPGVHYEEALLANSIIDDPENAGREKGFYAGLIALTFQFLGISVFSLKFVNALAGALTVLGAYLLTKETIIYAAHKTPKDSKMRIAPVGRETIAILAAGFTATSFWHIHFSRITTEAIFIPLLLSFGVWLILRALRKKSVLDSALALAVFASTVPVISHIIDAFGGGEGAVIGSDNFFTALMQSFGSHLQMLFINGDLNWRYNYAGEPQLALPVAFLFLVGLVYAFRITIDGVLHKTRDALVVHSFLISAMLVMAFPAAILAENSPNALLSLGMIPFVFIYAALGFLYFIRLMFPHKHHREEVWPLAFGAAMTIILVIASYQFPHYFYDWARQHDVKQTYSSNAVQAGKFFNLVPEDSKKYLIVNTDDELVDYPEFILSDLRIGSLETPGTAQAEIRGSSTKLPAGAQPSLFIQYTENAEPPNTQYITREELPILNAGQSIFVPLAHDPELQALIKDSYPTGEEFEFANGIWGYIVEF